MQPSEQRKNRKNTAAIDGEEDTSAEQEKGIVAAGAEKTESIVAAAQAEEDKTATIADGEVETTALSTKQEEDDASAGAGSRRKVASSPKWTTWPRVYSPELLLHLLTRYCTTSSSNTILIHHSSVRSLSACHRMRW
jgi:hypothetical protein